MRPASACHALHLLSFAAGAAAQQQQPADLIVTNARIYTVDDSHPLADAMAVRGGKVQFVGSSRRRAARCAGRPRA